jgi:protein-disulfide isomerase
MSIFAQPPATDPTIESLRRDMDELIKGQIELQKQVRELKNLLQPNQACAQAPKQNIVFDIAGAPSRGEANAPLIVIEFSDFQCPFSARYTSETFPRIEQEYIKTGKIHYVFRDFPLENIHPLAHKLAESGQCASEQKLFWELRTQLFAMQSAATSEEAIADLAKPAGVNSAALQKCLHEGQHSKKVDQERTEAAADGVTGTPTFFLGRGDPTTGKVKVLKVIVGAQPFEDFKQAIDSVLSEIRPPGSKI